jgi:hypothetical protein
LINLVFWIVGVALVVLAVWRVRRPFARLGELNRLADNARRYNSWRGNRALDDGPSGADVMRELLRRQVIVWAVVAAVGIGFVVAGFAIR